MIFLVGILLVQGRPDLPTLWPLAVAFMAATGLAWRFPRLLPLVFLVAGLLWTTFRAGLVLDEQLHPGLEGELLQVQGVIADLPRAAERGSRFEFAVEQAWHDDHPVVLPGRLLLSDYNSVFLPRVGDRWRLSVKLKRPHGFQNPGGFDYEAYLFQHRIRARGYVHQATVPQRLSQGGLAYGLGRVRQAVGEGMSQALNDHPFAGILIALANGDRRGLNDAQWEVMRQTGTSHLMAISGLHVGLVAGLIFFLVRCAWSLPGYTVLRWPAPRVAAVAALVAATGYAALAGFAIPTQRALVMLLVVLGGVVLKRRFPPTVLLAAALLAVLLYDPLSVMAPGFWLSFGAVAVLVYVGQVRHAGPRWRRWGAMQWAVAVGLAPLMLLWFQQLSLAAPLANLVAIPVFSLIIVPLTLLGVVALAVAPVTVAAWPLHGAAWVLTGLWQGLDGLAGQSWAAWAAPTPSFWALLGGCVGVVVLLAPRGWPMRWVGGLWLLPLAWPPLPMPAAGEVWLTLLDVGQGLAVVIHTRQHTLVYDTGPRYGEHFDTGEAVVVPYLRHQGTSHVDALVISHGDNDHIGGARSLLAAMPVRRVLSSVPAQLPGALPCQSGESWRWDEVEFAVLSPPPEHAGEGNDASCVLLVSGRQGRVLLPGDIEQATERALLAQYGPALAAEVLVAPHHGSKTSSSAEFLDAVGPAVVLVPAGYRNRYRHPHPDVLARYRARHMTVYDSARHGAVQLRLPPDRLVAESYRERQRRYWFSRPDGPS